MSILTGFPVTERFIYCHPIAPGLEYVPENLLFHKGDGTFKIQGV
jgi:hypothetical protein